MTTRLKDNRGFLTFAVGKEHDYVRMAYAQALSIKATQKNSCYCIIVDEHNAKQLTSKHYNVFDVVKVLPSNFEAVGWDMSCQWQAYNKSPWAETIKLDADMLLLSSIDHWWDILATNEVVLTTNICDFRGEPIRSRAHRKLFDTNGLPDVYSAFMYFRPGRVSSELFYYAERLTNEWATITLKDEPNHSIRSDELFALAARLTGVEKVTLPISTPLFVHAKEEVWNISSTVPWHEQLYTQWDGVKLLVGHHVQDRPFHYHHKEWLTDDIIERLERTKRYYEEPAVGIEFSTYNPPRDTST